MRPHNTDQIPELPGNYAGNIVVQDMQEASGGLLKLMGSGLLLATKQDSIYLSINKGEKPRVFSGHFYII